MLPKAPAGSRVGLLAGTYNAIADAVNRNGRTTSRASSPGSPQAGVVLVRNDSGATRGRFDILGIDGPVIDPVNNEMAALADVIVSGVEPATGTHDGAFVVLLSPAEDGVIVSGVISGVTWARCTMTDDADLFADITDGDAGQLLSGGGGAAQLLWVQPAGQRDDPDIALVIARIGGGGAGTAFPVQIVSTSGSSWPRTYTAARVNDDVQFGPTLDCHNYGEDTYPAAGTEYADSFEPFAADDIVLAWFEATTDQAGDALAAPRFAFWLQRIGSATTCP